MIHSFNRIASVHINSIRIDKLKDDIDERDLENLQPFISCKPERCQRLYTFGCDDVWRKTAQIVAYFRHSVQLAFVEGLIDGSVLGELVDSLSTARARSLFDEPFEDARAAEGVSTSQRLAVFFSPE